MEKMFSVFLIFSPSNHLFFIPPPPEQGIPCRIYTPDFNLVKELYLPIRYKFCKNILNNELCIFLNLNKINKFVHEVNIFPTKSYKKSLHVSSEL